MPDGYEASEIIDRVEERNERANEDAVVAFEWFEERAGELFDIDDAIVAVAEQEGWDEQRAREAVIAVSDDTADPVQVVTDPDYRHIGIIEYEPFDAEGGYGFIEYDDTIGQRRNVVCAKCVEEETLVQNCFRAVAGYTTYAEEGGGQIPINADYGPLIDRLTQHYIEEHDAGPESVDVGASLVSGTTINSNTAWHDGNVSGGANISIGSTSVAVSPQGSGSGLNAGQLEGNTAGQLGSVNTTGGTRTKTLQLYNGALVVAGTRSESTRVPAGGTDRQSATTTFTGIDGSKIRHAADVHITSGTGGSGTFSLSLSVNNSRIGNVSPTFNNSDTSQTLAPSITTNTNLNNSTVTFKALYKNLGGVSILFTQFATVYNDTNIQVTLT